MIYIILFIMILILIIYIIYLLLKSTKLTSTELFQNSSTLAIHYSDNDIINSCFTSKLLINDKMLVIPYNTINNTINNTMYITNLYIQSDNTSNIKNAFFSSTYLPIPIQYSSKEAPEFLIINNNLTKPIDPILTKNNSNIIITYNNAISYSNTIKVSFYGYCIRNSQLPSIDNSSDIYPQLNTNITISSVPIILKTIKMVTDFFSNSNSITIPYNKVTIDIGTDTFNLQTFTIPYYSTFEIKSGKLIIDQSNTVFNLGTIILNGGSLSIANTGTMMEGGIYNIGIVNFGTITMSSGTLNIANKGTDQQYNVGIMNLNNINILNGKISIQVSMNDYGIHNMNGSINLLNGNFTINTINNSYGIVNNNNKTDTINLYNMIKYLNIIQCHKIIISSGTFKITTRNYSTGIDNSNGSIIALCGIIDIQSFNDTVELKSKTISSIESDLPAGVNTMTSLKSNKISSIDFEVPAGVDTIMSLNSNNISNIDSDVPTGIDIYTCGISNNSKSQVILFGDKSMSNINISNYNGSLTSCNTQPDTISLNNNTNILPNIQYSKLFTVEYFLQTNEISTITPTIIYNYFNQMIIIESIKSIDTKNIDPVFFEALSTILCKVSSSQVIPYTNSNFNNHMIDLSPSAEKVFKEDSSVNLLGLVQNPTNTMNFTFDNELMKQTTDIIAIPIEDKQSVSMIDSNSTIVCTIIRSGNTINIDNITISMGSIFKLPGSDILYKFIAVGSPIILYPIITPPQPNYNLKYNTNDIINVYNNILFQSNIMLNSNNSSSSSSNINNIQNQLTFKSNYTDNTSLLSNIFISNIIIQYNGNSNGMMCQFINDNNVINLDVITTTPPLYKTSNSDIISTQLINTNNHNIISENIIIPLNSSNSNNMIKIGFSKQNSSSNSKANGFDSPDFKQDSITIAYYGYFRLNAVTDDGSTCIYGNKIPDVNAMPSMTLYGGEGFGNTTKEHLDNSPLFPNLFTITLPINSNNIDNNGNVTNIIDVIQIPNIMNGTISCFNENTQILCLVDSNDTYLKIQDIRPGTLVKTYKHGYRKVSKIGKRTSYNNPDNWTDCMYILPKTGNMIDELIISGLHGILVDTLTIDDIEKYKELNAFDNLSKIDDMFVLIAAASKRFTKITNNDTYTYYHLILDNEGDMNARYGIYANGILTETPTVNIFDDFKFELIE